MIRHIAAALLLTAGAAFAQGSPSDDGAEVYIISPQDGATVSSPVLVQMGLRTMGVAPAGVDVAGTGHHHIFVNRAPFGEADMTEIIPNDDNHRHFGMGQTEAMLDLPPGEHTLQLVLGDHGHVPHDPPVVSDVITVVVE